MVASASCDLTPREIEVLRLIAGGKSSKQAAYALGLSFHTVLSHRYRIFQKLGITKTAELVIRAAQMGVIDLRASEAPPALPQRILALHQESIAEQRKLTALIEESRMIRRAARKSCQEFRAVRKDVRAAVKKIVAASRHSFNSTAA